MSHPIIGRLEQVLDPWLAPRTEYNPKPKGAAAITSPNRMRRYAEAALEGECRNLALMPPKSGRNCELFRAGCRLGKWAHHGVLAPHEIEAALLRACSMNKLIKDDGLKACKATLASGLRKAEGDELPTLEDRTLPSDAAQNGNISSFIFFMMDRGLTDDDVRSEIGRDDIDGEIAHTRAQWQGEAQRMRAHAKTVQQQPTTNVPTDGAALLDQVHAFLGRFVAYPSEHTQDAHTLWIAHTHAMDAWESSEAIEARLPAPKSTTHPPTPVDEKPKARQVELHLDRQPIHRIRRLEREERREAEDAYARALIERYSLSRGQDRPQSYLVGRNAFDRARTRRRR